MSNFGSQYEELQRRLAEAMRPMAEMMASMDFSRSARAMLGAMRPALEMTASMDFSHSARALLSAMRPLIVDNQHFHAAMLSGTTQMTSSMAGVLSSPAYKQGVINSVESMQAMLADLVKSFDLSSYSDVLSQISARLNEVGVDGDFEIDEEQQAELKADLAVIADEDKKVSRYKKFNKMIRKWHDRNFAVFVLLFLIDF